MLRPIFGHSFAVLVAPILFSVLTFNFLNKKKTSARTNAEDVDTGTSGPMAALTESNSSGSSPSPTRANNDASSLLTGNSYDVFLSFRGRDTRYGFSDHLYNGLIGAGINAFRDDRELHQGENIRPGLLAAITNSNILIPILSVNYGTSSWCLDELVQIMERKNNNGQIVLPIFYKVKPAEVKYQIGRFGHAFHEHERRSRKRHFNPMTLKKWKQALFEVSTLKGFDADGSEVELVKGVVKKVLGEVKKKFGLVIPENLVGIDAHMKKVMEFVDNNSHATLFVGIYGMGGIGKTTLAKAIYNKLCNQFEHRSFITNIRELWNHNDVLYLQNQLIYDILKQKDEVCNEDEGTNFISTNFKCKKVLILLDDVDKVVQLKRLAGNRDWFSMGSRIIITTRNKRILENFGVDYSYCHKEMDNDQSLILFSKHAFRRDSPPREFEALTHEVVSIIKGLPLSLEVLGSLLYEKERTLWRDTIDKLKKVPPLKVQEKLMISYEALEYNQQQIFLDIACFFIGTNKRIAFYMWHACDFYPEEGIKELELKSLIKIEDDHELIMHDQLRDLGRTIVKRENQRQPWHRSRLWDSKEASRVLKRYKGTNKIEAIILSEDSSDEEESSDEEDGNTYTEKHFENLTDLRFLDMNGAYLRGNFRNLIGGLKWLGWQGCPMNFEIKNLHVKRLAVLDLSRSNINKKWKGWSSFMMAEKLKFLDLTLCQSLENTDFLSTFKNLEVLILNNCFKLHQIDSSIGDMTALLRLELCGCSYLMELPTEIGKLKALQQLHLRDTEALYALPNSIGLLQNLEILDISNSGLKELPDGIGKLRKLQHLDASRCKKLGGEMQESIGSLENPEIFASGVEELTNDGGRPRKLQNLNVSRCQNVGGEMLKSMCNLSSLQYLNFLGCMELQSLPTLPSSLTYLGVTCQSCKLPSLSHLTHLKELKVHKCKFLERIQELPSTLLKNSKCSQPIDVEESKLPQYISTPFKLEILEVEYCESIEILDVSQFIHLRTLSARHCKTILEVRVLDNLKYLESLIIECCNSIERLDLSKFNGLLILDVCNCHKLVEIQGLDGLALLENLYISSCTSIERLLLPKFASLKILGVSSCMKLTEIQGLNRLAFLEELHIHWCTSIKKLHLPKSEGLKILKIKSCDVLVEIQGLNSLEFLKVLNIFECPSIERLDLPKLGSLKELAAKNCENLAKIQGLDRLEFLEILNIFQCTSIKMLDLPRSKVLMTIAIENCNNLVKIKGLNRLESLERLDISLCTSIEMIDLSTSTCMKTLHVNNCANLIKIQCLDRLESLERLDILLCASIERLNLPKAVGMKKLHVKHCTKLVEIYGLNILESLEELDISNCASIKRLDFSNSMGMKTLHVNSCANLVKIQCLDRLESLERLDISSCDLIERLDLSKFAGMRKLVIEHCANLVIYGLDILESLEELRISNCASIERLNLSKSASIYRLIAMNCANLVEIHGLDGLEFLEYLDVSCCASIERLDVLKSVGMKVLCAESCAKLIEIHGLDRLESLKELKISQCALIERLDLPKSTGMKMLYAVNCANLIEVHGLNRLESLVILDISGCTSFERLPNLCCFDTLQNLTIDCCDELKDIQSLERFPSCTSLCIKDCKSLAKLPNLSSFHNLGTLILSNCHELREIPGLEVSISLELIAISGCSSIETLPDLSSLTRLIHLVVKNCEKLTELQGLEKLERLEKLDISRCNSLETIPELLGTRLYQNYEEKSFAYVGAGIRFWLSNKPDESIYPGIYLLGEECIDSNSK